MLEVLAVEGNLIAMPFGNNNTFTLSTKGLLYHGRNHNINITVTGINDGRERYTIHYPHTPVRVRRRDVEAFVEQFPAEGGWKDLILNAELPETFPTHHYFVVDDRGQVWLKMILSAEKGTSTWYVLNKDSKLVGEAVWPSDASYTSSGMGAPTERKKMHTVRPMSWFTQ